MKEGDLVTGRYRLVRRIGAGAMGTVWAARHELIGRDLALKICALAPERSRSSRQPPASSLDARDRFLREVRIVGGLRHPNVVDIVDAGDTGVGELYLAMELLEGESLAERIARGTLPPGDALAVAAEVCRGLAAAHAAGVVHRDLKPENVFLARGPGGGVVPKLLDFGVSSVGGAGLDGEELFGTPAYMSPEQALGAGVDHRTDVWALGVVLYEMVTGELPFRAESYPALLPRIIEQPHPPLPASVPPSLRTVVAGCLAKDPGDRYATADALLEGIERARASLSGGEPGSVRSGFFVETGAVAAQGAPVVPGVALPARRTPRLGLVLGILALPLAVGILAIGARVGGPGRVAGAVGPAPASPPPSEHLPAVAASVVPPAPALVAASAAPGASSAPAPSASAAMAVPVKRSATSRTSSKVTRVNTAGF